MYYTTTLYLDLSNILPYFIFITFLAQVSSSTGPQGTAPHASTRGTHQATGNPTSGSTMLNEASSLATPTTPSTNEEPTSNQMPPGTSTGPTAAPANSTATPGATRPSNQELGIITDQPRRFEFARLDQRTESYRDPWPRGHHLDTGDLAEAGFYYAGESYMFLIRISVSNSKKTRGSYFSIPH